MQFDPLEAVHLWHEDSQRVMLPDFVYDSDSESDLDLCSDGELSLEEEDEGDKDDLNWLSEQMMPKEPPGGHNK